VKNFLYTLITVIILINTIALASCRSNKKTTATVQEQPADSLVAYLERTPCFGKCPYYSIRVYRSGYTLYEGKRDVEKTGRYYTWLSKDEVESIGKKAEELNYFSLNDEYRNPHLTDFPTIYSEVRYNGKKKKITHYEVNPPESLVKMEDFIDSLFIDEKWMLHPDQSTRE
jgi:hypothetical protein